MPPQNRRQNSDRKKHYLDKLSALKAEREPYFKLWRELSEFIRPDRGRFLAPDQNKKNTDLVSIKIFDSTGTLSVRTLASGMMAGVTSPARPWFTLEPAERIYANNPAISKWIKDIQRTMFDVFARSNLYNALHSLYGELVVFGTAAILIDADYEDVLKAYPLTAGEYFLATNAKHEVDSLYRELTMSAKQAVQKFGFETLSKETQELINNGKSAQKVTFIHIIEPNTNARPDIQGSQAVDSQYMPYISLVFEKNSKDDAFTKISGYHEFPLMCPRWSVTGNEVYGFSPGIEALPDIKQLQHEQRKKGQAIDKKVSPPLQAPASMKQSAVNGLPGGVTFYDETRQHNGIKPTYEVNLNLSELAADIQEVQQRIGRIFYEDLFLMIAQMQNKQMTAREIEERHEEKMLMLGPVFERLHNELLDPLIKRTFAIIKRAGLLPPPPPGFTDIEMKVEYVSVMAQTQRLVDTQKIERFLDFVQRVQMIQPEIAEQISLENTVQDVAALMGVSQAFNDLSLEQGQPAQ